MAITVINSAKLLANGVLLNGSTTLPDGNFGFLRDLYNDWLQSNSPDPIETLDEAKARKKQELYQAADSAITGGFSSSALGAPNDYDSRIVDQHNLKLAVLGSQKDTLNRDVYADAGGGFTFQSHTTAQLEQVEVDMEAHISAQRSNLNAKIALVNAAIDIPAVDLITF